MALSLVITYSTSLKRRSCVFYSILCGPIIKRGIFIKHRDSFMATLFEEFTINHDLLN